MKRPPDRKLVVALTALLVAASAFASRPAVSTDAPAAGAVSFVKLLGRS